MKGLIPHVVNPTLAMPPNGNSQNTDQGTYSCRHSFVRKKIWRINFFATKFRKFVFSNDLRISAATKIATNIRNSCEFFSEVFSFLRLRYIVQFVCIICNQ